MADVLIRQANIDDVDAIFEIEHLCFPDPWSKDSLRYELGENPRAFYIVAEIDGSVVGYAGLWWKMKGISLTWQCDQGIAAER